MGRDFLMIVISIYLKSITKVFVFCCPLDSRETLMAPCEPLLSSNVVAKEQPTLACNYQTNVFTLFRPRDFISALNKEKAAEISQTPTASCYTFSSGDAESIYKNRECYLNTEDIEKRDR